MEFKETNQILRRGNLKAQVSSEICVQIHWDLVFLAEEFLVLSRLQSYNLKRSCEGIGCIFFCYFTR